MPSIRNLALIKRFTDYFKLKTNDMLDSEAGNMLMPVVSIPVPPNIVVVRDVKLNDSDKTITVPVGKQWKILYASIRFIASAQAGNRRIQIIINDDNSNIVWDLSAINVQVASTTERYMLAPGVSNSQEDFAGRHVIPLPSEAILGGGFIFRFLDSAAIDVAVDDMIINMVVEETDVEDR